MKKRQTTIMAVAFLSIGACQGGYAGSTYQPVIDVQASKNQPTMNADLEYCRSLSEQRSVFTAGGQSALIGTGIGAAGGAITGALSGGAGMGALAGAGLGFVSAASYGALRGNKEKQDIVIECLRNRGAKVVAR